MGIDEVTVTANKEVGGLCWAKYGFSAEKQSILDIIAERYKDGKISIREYNEAIEYVKSYNYYVPMQELAYSKYGTRLLKGTSWKGKVNIHDEVQMSYIKKYLGI